MSEDRVVISKNEFFSAMDHLCGMGVTEPDDQLNIDDAQKAFEDMSTPLNEIGDDLMRVIQQLNHAQWFLTALSGHSVAFDPTQLKAFLRCVQCDVKNALTKVQGN